MTIKYDIKPLMSLVALGENAINDDTNHKITTRAVKNRISSLHGVSSEDFLLSGHTQ